jgi:DNA-binding CsgD family transcriptional regulator
MPRGRPKHPDILTPREWQVLDLIREGLTNDQIARRLGISENGAKYHVLEILSKLGVSSRYEAAAWRREPAPVSRRFAGLAALFALRPKLSAVTVSKAALASLTVTVFGFMAALAIGVAVMNHRSSGAGMTAEPTSQAIATTEPPDTETSPTLVPLSPEPEDRQAVTTGTTPEAFVLGVPTPTPVLSTGLEASDDALPRGAVPPPSGTPAPTATPAPSPTLGPDVISVLPSGVEAALTAAGAEHGLSYYGECAAGVQGGQLCYNLQDGSPRREGASIHIILRVAGQLMAAQVIPVYDVVLNEIGDSQYEVVTFTGPAPFSIAGQ